MTLEHELIDIPGHDGKKLVGILWHPAADVPSKRTLIVMSHGGLSHKLGANRVQYNLGRWFASRGYTVFRFDPDGFGDSDGRIEARARQDLFNAVESGHCVESYRNAFAVLEERYADHRWVVSGVCGGAISALLGGMASPHPIAGFALISCPVILDGLQFDYSRREPVALALPYVCLLLQKLFSPRALWSFVTFKSDYARMWKNAHALLLWAKDKVRGAFGLGPKKKMDGALPAGETTTAGQGAAVTKPAVGLNPRFVAATKEAMRSSNVLFIFGDNDGFLWEFRDHYAAAHLSDAQRDKVLRVVKHANHMFVWQEWQREAFESIDAWLSNESTTAGVSARTTDARRAAALSANATP